MGFCMELIPALRRAGYRYVIVDSEHVEAVTPMRWEELRYRRIGRASAVKRSSSSCGTASFPTLRKAASTQAGSSKRSAREPNSEASAARHDGYRRRQRRLVPEHVDAEQLLGPFLPRFLERVRSNQSAGIRPRSSTTTSKPMEPKVTCGFVPVRGTPAGTAEPASSNGRDQAQRRSARASRPGEPCRPCGLEQGRRLQERGCTPLPITGRRSVACPASRASCNFFWGDAWVQRCNDDLDVACSLLGEAASRSSGVCPTRRTDDVGRLR